MNTVRDYYFKPPSEKKGVFFFKNKVLKKVRKNVIFTTNSALWFMRDLKEPIQIFKPQEEEEVKVVFNPNEETVSWLKNHRKQYCWIYTPKEVGIKEAKEHFSQQYGQESEYWLY